MSRIFAASLRHTISVMTQTEIKIGTHFWALMDDRLVVMLRCEDGFYVCGGWEGDIPIDKFEFVSEIKKPNNTKLYYQ